MLMNLLGKLYLYSFRFAVKAGVFFEPTTESTTDATVKDITDKIYTPMNILIKVICYGMAGVGAIVCIKAVVDFITAYPQHDSAAMIGAAKWLVAGLILASIGVIVPLFWN